ncbi:MAG: EAL domain-containing protein [bacterium]
MFLTDDYAFLGIARRYLGLARTSLGMEQAWVAEHTGRGQIVCAVDGVTDLIDLSEGMKVPCDCPLRVERQGADGTTVVGSVPTRANDDSHPVDHVWRDVNSYASTPVRLADGRIFGTLSCASRDRRMDLGPSDARLLRALAGALGEEITVFAARAESRDARRAEIEQVITGDGLHMVAQPIVRLDTMASVGFEALSRFDASPFKPDRWFSDAASLGVGLPLELTAIRRGLALLDQMPEESYISVNASPSAMCSEDLLDALATVDARRVVIELTEHHSVSNYDSLRGRLANIRGQGARVAVDDAGAGYASFRHILNLRPDMIKLDRGLISGISTDRARQALVSALMHFATGLGAVVVAEGIETSEELECAAYLGVSLGQGYFIARPGPVPALLAS